MNSKKSCGYLFDFIRTIFVNANNILPNIAYKFTCGQHLLKKYFIREMFRSLKLISNEDIKIRTYSIINRSCAPHAQTLRRDNIG